MFSWKFESKHHEYGWNRNILAMEKNLFFVHFLDFRYILRCCCFFFIFIVTLKWKCTQLFYQRKSWDFPLPCPIKILESSINKWIDSEYKWTRKYMRKKKLQGQISMVFRGRKNETENEWHTHTHTYIQTLIWIYANTSTERERELYKSAI